MRGASELSSSLCRLASSDCFVSGFVVSAAGDTLRAGAKLPGPVLYARGAVAWLAGLCLLGLPSLARLWLPLLRARSFGRLLGLGLLRGRCSFCRLLGLLGERLVCRVLAVVLAGQGAGLFRRWLVGARRLGATAAQSRRVLVRGLRCLLLLALGFFSVCKSPLKPSDSSLHLARVSKSRGLLHLPRVWCVSRNKSCSSRARLTCLWLA